MGPVLVLIWSGTVAYPGILPETSRLPRVPVSFYYIIVLVDKMSCNLSIHGTENLNIFIHYPTCLSNIVSLTHPVDKQWRTQEFCSWVVQQIQLRTEDRENGDLGALAPLVRGSGGSCNLVQEISFHIVKFS